MISLLLNATKSVCPPASKITAQSFAPGSPHCIPVYPAPPGVISSERGKETPLSSDARIVSYAGEQRMWGHAPGESAAGLRRARAGWAGVRCVTCAVVVVVVVTHIVAAGLGVGPRE